MRIYKIAHNKEARLFDIFGTPYDKLQEIAKSFIEKYFDSKNRLPTIGHIIMDMMDSHPRADQDVLRGIAMSELSSFRNLLQEV